MENKPKGLAIAGLVTGIVGCVFSLATCTFVIGLPVAIIGCILSGIALKKCGDGTGDGKGLAIGGLVTGVIGVFWSIYIIFIAGAVVNEGINELEEAFDAYDDVFEDAMDELDDIDFDFDNY